MVEEKNEIKLSFNEMFLPKEEKESILQNKREVEILSEELIKDDSDKLKIYKKRGILYFDLNEYGKAIDDFSQAIDLISKENTDLELYFLRSEAYHSKAYFMPRTEKETSRSIVAIQLIRSNFSDYHESQNEFMPTSLHLFDYSNMNNEMKIYFAKAIIDIDLYLAIVKNNHNAYLSRAITKKALKMNPLDDFKKSIELNPNDARIYLFRASYLLDSIKDIDIDNLLSIALSLEKSKEQKEKDDKIVKKYYETIDKAKKDLINAVKINPNLRDAYRFLANIYIIQRNPHKSKQALRNFLNVEGRRLDPNEEAYGKIALEDLTKNFPDGNCYIATACYGSYDEKEVVVLRKFRDEYLLKSGIGKLFVKLYYLISPHIAGKLRNHKRINTFVKNNFLDRIVKIIEK
jgi:tetratricopeptide (TPR) repeat protein